MRADRLQEKKIFKFDYNLFKAAAFIDDDT